MHKLFFIFFFWISTKLYKINAQNPRDFYFQLYRRTIKMSTFRKISNIQSRDSVLRWLPIAKVTMYYLARVSTTCIVTVCRLVIVVTIPLRTHHAPTTIRIHNFSEFCEILKRSFQNFTKSLRNVSSIVHA